MKTDLLLRIFKVLPALLGMIDFFLLLSPTQASAGTSVPASSYCSAPPMAGSGVKPNLLLLLDNSASMYDLAYSDPSAYCVDDSYRDDNYYGGYFDPYSIYSYDGTNAMFVPGATLPSPPCSSGSCIASTNYLYLDMTGTAPNRTASNIKASGNFLNWLSMSKLDIEKQVLTGGKFLFDASGTSGKLVAETRGCQGKRFVKIVMLPPQQPGLQLTQLPVTFAVRGPIPSEADYVYTASHGGGTRIEIYDKQYDKADCLAAVSDFQSPNNLSKLRTDASNCVGAANLVENVGGVNIPSKNKTYIDIMSNCYANPTNVLGDGTVRNDCKARLTKKYSLNPLLIYKSTGDDVCAEGLNHALSVHPGFPINSTGFLGNCWTVTGGGIFTNPCAENEAEDYCRDITNPSLTDPSATAMVGTNINIPSFLLDAGIYSVGDVAGTFRARVSLSSPPTGLIQEFSNDINLGAMIFNDNGSGSECKHENIGLTNGGINPGDIPCIKRCYNGSTDSGSECHLDTDCSSGYQCLEIPLTDGGKIISAINSPIGTHKPSSGLISSIDQVTASSWTPLAESFYTAMGYFGNRTDTRPGAHLWPSTADVYGAPPSKFSCQRNNILIVSDGVSTADRHSDVSGLLTNWAVQMPPSTTTGVKRGDSVAYPPFQGSYNLDDLAWLARNRALADFGPIGSTRDYLSTYIIYTGLPCGAYNADGTCTTSDEGVSEKMMQLTASKGGGKIADAQDPADMEGAFRDMLQHIAAGSGTDASILSTGNGNGAVFLQAQFYPTKSFDGGTTSASWLGELESLWYYIDPFLGGTVGAGSTVREDTDGDLKLNLKQDRVVKFQDNGVSLFVDANGDGISDDGTTQAVSADAVKALWRAGIALWQRPANDRMIYTQTNGTSLTSFASLNTADPKVVQLLQAQDASEAQQIISYVTGVDSADAPSFRNRTMTIPADTIPGVSAATNVWKLGDIISSTPKVQSSVALNSYQLASGGYNDASYRSFITSNDYANRGTVYVGANDGMLHAFNLGKLNAAVSGDVKATLEPRTDIGETRTDLGKEKWAFIPKNALPYLTYLKDPAYQHLHYVDGDITLTDVSIGDTNSGACVKGSYWNCLKQMSVTKGGGDNSLDPTKNTWRTVLIGGMGLGGASGASCEPGTDCVPTPIADPSSPTARLGYSSYFALDVTDPDHPSLLWEFSDPALGYSTTGPAIVRIGDPSYNGRWFAVFGSGPTGPVDIASHQFIGRSSQELKFFVVDLRTGELVTTIATGIQNAFAGSMSGAAIDADRATNVSKGIYQDDALYVGYTQAGAGGSWTGGVLRILTKENPDPTQWLTSTVINGIGPITSSIARIQDTRNHNLWLYFGTGRYFFSQDDMPGPRALYGIKEPCYNFKAAGVVNVADNLDPNCSASVGAGSLTDQTATGSGWLLNLDPAAGANGAERLVTNPVSMNGGAIFFTTFQPSTDPCLPGNSYLWRVGYETGGAVTDGSIQGKVLVPLSTESMQETGLSGSFTDKGGRRSAPMAGKPGGIKIISNSGLRPLKKIIHIQER
jgi:type IV pilus assembly protein PilY1